MAMSDVDMSSSLDHDEEPLAELTDEELYNLVQENLHANDVLKNETTMFEKYLKRVDPKDIKLQQAATQGPTQPVIESSHRGLRKKSRSRGPSLDRHLKLTAEQKCDIAQRELEELRDEIEKLKDESEKILDNFRAVMEEADIRSAEVKKSSYEFERDIVKGAVNQRTNKVIAERVTKYLEDKLRSRDTAIEKLRLKNSTLKVQKRKLHMQLKQKEEMGEVLHEVDSIS
ncbi:cilia- and flagella-associated protein 263-like [Montipora foliosa]|uniref:cilia- and flagella-associated protein 263-like n=1 Tax=Montipora foliosa TaxID=591990 RepID=UPI0035F1F6A4